MDVLPLNYLRCLWYITSQVDLILLVMGLLFFADKYTRLNRGFLNVRKLEIKLRLNESPNRQE